MEVASRIRAGLDWFVPDSVKRGDGEAELRSRVLVAAGLVGGLVSAAFLGHRLLVGETTPARLWTVGVSAALFWATPFLLKTTQSLRTASGALIAFVCAMIATDGYLYGGLGAPAFAALMVVPVLGTLLLGATAGWLTGLAAASLILGFFLLGAAGHRFPATPPEDQLLMMHAVAWVGVVSFLTILANVFEARRRANEKRLAAGEQRYRRAFHARNEGLMVVHMATDQVELSQRLADYLGEMSRDMPLDAFLERLHPQDATGFRASLADGPDAAPSDFRMRRADGRMRFTELTFSHDHAADAAMVTVTDVHDARNTAALKEEFVSNVSHELRTPLTSLRGALALVEEGALGELNDKANKAVGIARRNAERLVTLVDDLLDIQKLEGGAFEMALETFEVSTVVSEAVATLQPYAEQFSVKLSVQRRHPEAHICADKQRLTQVLANLISNAVKFSPQEESVVIEVREVAPFVEVRVTDRGPGVPDDFVPQLFDKFSQADRGDSTKVKGTGLGLSISKGIVEAMGGEIGYDPSTPHGSEFWVRLPSAPPRTGA